MDEMQPIDDLHRAGCPSAKAVGGEVAAITTGHSDRRMPPQPGREHRGRAVREQVDDAMRHEIDEDGAIQMASSPRPLVDADRL
jgi:hypothetical protein